MNDDQLRRIMEETARRLHVAQRPDILAHADVFPKQREVILHPAKLKAIFCTRRAAKSYTLGMYGLHEAVEHPGSNILLTGLTRDSAKGIFWKDIMMSLDKKYGLKLKPNLTELSITLPNESFIKITGIDAFEQDMYKLLGKKWRFVGVDEGSMYTIDLRNFIYGVLKPAMADERGTICLAGTASDFPRGLFYDVTTGKEPGWQLFEWTALDNPHVAKQWQEELDEIARDRPLYMETPQYKQWYLNQWVIDEEKLCYKFTPGRNLISPAEWQRTLARLSVTEWARVLGVDTGWEDDNAFVMTAYHLNDPVLYVPKHFCKPKMYFDDEKNRPEFGVVQKIQEWMRAPGEEPHRVVIDGANKQGVESMKQRSNIPFEYADKNDKATFIELASSDLVQGKIKIVDTPENRPLWQEMAALIWVTDAGKIRLPKKENPSLSNHRCDAFLYAWRMGYHFNSEPAAKKVVKGSAEWYRQQSEDIWEREREQLMEEARKREEDPWG